MIWHLLPLSRWQPAEPVAVIPAGGDRFVHASPDEQVALAVAGAVFGELAEPLVGLGLDEAKLSAPVRYEPGDPAPPPGVPASTRFPHIYGPVETSAVAEVRFARRDLAGAYVSLEARPATAAALGLVPHPEGGWYRQTWAAGPAYQPAGYPGSRPAATAIYYLLPPGAESRWHTVRSGELWLWHGPGPLALRLGGTGPHPGEPTVITLGPDVGAGQHPHYLVPGGHWQSAHPAAAAEVLVTCVVAPGFDFTDFTVPPAAGAAPPA